MAAGFARPSFISLPVLASYKASPLTSTFVGPILFIAGPPDSGVVKVCYQRSDFNPKNGRQFGRREADLRDDLPLGAGGVVLQVYVGVAVGAGEVFRLEGVC